MSHEAAGTAAAYANLVGVARYHDHVVAERESAAASARRAVTAELAFAREPYCRAMHPGVVEFAAAL
jgi:hypothetical protein